MAIDRRSVMRGGAAALALAPFAPAFAADRMPFAVAHEWVSNAQYAGTWIALDKGFFAEEGLAVTYTPGGPNATSPLVLLAAGKAQLGHTSWLALLDAIAKGNDFVVIGALFPITPFGFISLPRRPVRKVEELVDAKVLIQDNIARELMDATLKFNKLPVRYTTATTGFSPEPLLAGDGDAYCCFIDNQPIALELMGMKPEKDFFVRSISDFGWRAPEVIFTVRRDFLEAHRPALVGFLRALLRAWVINAKDPALGARLAVENYGVDLGLDLAHETRLNVLQTPLTTLPGTNNRFWLDSLEIGHMFALAALTGRTNLPSPLRTIDMTLLEEAAAHL
jgi:ABC-type nitrate/sulfonate/bicarbonate transport system substrate-binding protein